MLVHVAQGTCETCGKTERQSGSTPTEATILLTHGHGYEYRHGWRGQITTHQEEEKCATSLSSSKRSRW
jgi:hypothetical protein